MNGSNVVILYFHLRISGIEASSLLGLGVVVIPFTTRGAGATGVVDLGLTIID